MAAGQQDDRQPFKFENALPDGFVYDTEPPSRAVLAVGRLQPEQTLKYFVAVQAAFYRDGKDVTQPEVLAGIAAEFDVDADEFTTVFESEDLREATRQHFRRSHQAGVRGFPTTVLQYGENVKLLAAGYVPFEQIAADIDQQLAVTE